ncbi:MAG: response regulator [Treponema sp.]|jgi:CheY-like chemotaxis protein|nr:response regulator [Treponema sp.]
MINRERLLAISELKLAGIQKMDEGKFEAYVRSLNSFIECLPAQEEKMKASLEAKDYASLAKALADVRNLLEAIHAGYMADECTKQIKELKNVRHEKLEVFMTYFLANLSMLSIDIQMAEHKEEGGDAFPFEKKQGGGKGGQAEQKSILAVDDTAFFLTMLKTTLQDTEYKLTCVKSGEDALKFLEKRHVDLLLLDIEMPDMDGYKLAAKIRESGQKAPIIFLTGNAQKENVTKALKAGAADFIVKPINKDVIIAKISRYI